MFFNTNNNSIYYEKYGNNNKTILILPGWGNTRPTFYHIINRFKQDYTIYILDYPGLGNSKIPEEDLTIYDYANIIRDFMINFNIKNPIIIAHSFGGRLTTILSGYYKIPIKKLILIDIASIKPKKTILQKIKQTTYKLLRKLVKLLPKLKQEYFNQKLIKIFASPDFQTIPKVMQQTFKNIVNEDLTKYLKGINTESIIIWGENDLDTPLKDAKKINKEIKNSALIILKKANHYSYLQYPILVNNIIYEFIK